MSIIMQINPFEFFTDTNGDALDSGYIYIGEVNKDPRQYPVAIYYDEALTIPAAMPLRTSNGYVVRNGSPTFLYINGNYSIRVEDKKHRQIYYVADFLLVGNSRAVSVSELGASSGAGMVGWARNAITSSISDVGGFLNSQPVSVWEKANLAVGYTPGGDPSAWDWAPAINAILSQYGNCQLNRGRFGIASQIVMQPGCILSGVGPGYAGGTEYSSIPSSVLVALPAFSGSSVITSSLPVTDNVLTAVGLSEFRLDLFSCPEHGIVLTDVYDGVLIDNVHVIGSAADKRGLWFASGSYGLGQTVGMRNVQVIARSNSTATVSPFRADALNESVFSGCKFFGSFGGVNASLGACVELSGCGGILFDGCSTAFGDVGISLVDHPSRKNYGITMHGCTFEALRTTAVKIRGSATRKATEIYVRSTRYYDSVFTMTNAVDVDFVEQSLFECSFKKAILGAGADQNTLTIQRQNFVTDGGTNNLILSQPNVIDGYYGINKKIRAIGGIQSDAIADLGGGISYFTRTFVAASGAISPFDGVILINRTLAANYTLPLATAAGTNRTFVIRIKSIGSAASNILISGSDTINGAASISIGASPASLTLVSDGISAWYSM